MAVGIMAVGCGCRLWLSASWLSAVIKGRGCRSCACGKGMRQGHAARACGKGMRQGHAARACDTTAPRSFPPTSNTPRYLVFENVRDGRVRGLLATAMGCRVNMCQDAVLRLWHRYRTARGIYRITRHQCRKQSHCWQPPPRPRAFGNTGFAIRFIQNS